MPDGPPTGPAVEPAPSSDVISDTDPDPHGFTEFARGLSNNTQKRAKAAVVAAAMQLDQGERVRDFICGQYLGYDGVAVLTDRRVLFANNRTFSPETASVLFSDFGEVKGWAEAKRATLRIATGNSAFVLGDVVEIDRAQEFAQTLRGLANR